MAHDNYWKDRYNHAWATSSKRERTIMERTRDETGLTAVPIGLGAGSTEYLSGSAKSRGFERGAADLHIEGTDIYLEVTGPQLKSVGPEDPLWVRPDKVEAARKAWPRHRVYVIHWLELDGTLRVIPLRVELFRAIANGELQVEEKVIRGARENYVVIPAHSRFVHTWDDFVSFLRDVRP